MNSSPDIGTSSSAKWKIFHKSKTNEYLDTIIFLAILLHSSQEMK